MSRDLSAGPAPEAANLPMNYGENEGVDPFKQLLILRCFRADRIVTESVTALVVQFRRYRSESPAFPVLAHGWTIQHRKHASFGC